jgi:hypothetical protein
LLRGRRKKKIDLEGILTNIKIGQFLTYAFAYNGRLLSALETKDRKSLTKPYKGESWNPASKTALITHEYLAVIKEFVSTKFYSKSDYCDRIEGARYAGKELTKFIDEKLLGEYGFCGNPDAGEIDAGEEDAGEEDAGEGESAEVEQMDKLNEAGEEVFEAVAGGATLTETLESLNVSNHKNFRKWLDGAEGRRKRYEQAVATGTEKRKRDAEDEKFKISFCRRLGVVVYDCLMAQIGKESLEYIISTDAEKLLSELFSKFIEIRTDKIVEKINAFVTPPNRVVLLQEVGEAQNIELIEDGTFKMFTTASQTNKIKESNAGSVILTGMSDNLSVGINDESTKYELENSKLTVNDTVVQLFSFHGDTKGKETTKAIDKILKAKKGPLIIGLDSNLKTDEQLYEFMVMCKSNGAKIAGFELAEISTVGEEPDRDFKTFFTQLQKVATNGGIRSGCQAQWTKMHEVTADYIDFIVYRGEEVQNRVEDQINNNGRLVPREKYQGLKQVKKDGTEPTLLTLESVNGAGDDVAALKSLVKNAGIVDSGVDGWGSKVLSATNPSDHLPRCSTFVITPVTANQENNKRLQNVKDMGTTPPPEPFSVMSWNVAGPNFNWAEYYGTDKKSEIVQAMTLIESVPPRSNRRAATVKVVPGGVETVPTPKTVQQENRERRAATVKGATLSNRLRLLSKAGMGGAEEAVAKAEAAAAKVGGGRTRRRRQSRRQKRQLSRRQQRRKQSRSQAQRQQSRRQQRRKQSRSQAQRRQSRRQQRIQSRRQQRQQSRRQQRRQSRRQQRSQSRRQSKRRQSRRQQSRRTQKRRN